MPYPYLDLCTGCPENVECETAVYCGPPLPATGIETGDTMVVALQKIDQAIFNITGPLTTTTTTTIP